ncbi:hypothetical protein GCM10011316_04530 [Roseibium aquae]|uniref:Mitochondrial fission protein ELM1 n=1 Tax=Roseibium aquae TaxID=1323746 RepID=A0A916T981_9HYPH|nr:hypothetical protein GCM10011316_04530 [Roseibium aquae]
MAPPFPDLVIGSGRRAVPYLRHLKAASDGRIFTVCLKDPRTGPSAADFIWVPEHDRLRAGNVLATLTGPHRFSQTLLETQRRETHTEIDALRTPRVAVLVGGNSRHHRFTEKDISSFTTGLAAIADGAGASCLITLSRRTPDALKNRLADFARSGPHLFYDGTGRNPIAAFLAKADAIVVTADSANMIGEVLATGRPVHVFRPAGGHRKMDRFLGTLSSRGLIHPFPGPLKTTTYEPVDATPEIAAHILKRYAVHTHRFVR